MKHHGWQLFRAGRAAPAMAAAALLWTAGSAAARTDLLFTRTFELSDVGLKIRLMPSAVQTHLAPPVAQTYEVQQGTNQWKSDLFAPEDLWRQSQHAGAWTDEHGNTVALAAVRDPLPEGFPRAHVSVEEYQQKLRALAPHGGRPVVPAEALPQWVAQYAGATAADPQPLPLRASGLKSVTEYRLAGQAATDLAFVFDVARSPSSLRSGTPTRFLVLFHLKPDVAAAAAHAAIVRTFLPSVTAIDVTPARPTPTYGAGEEAAHKREQQAPSPELQASRAQAAAGIRNMQGWWYLETPSYIILSNLKTRHHALIEQLQTDLELLRALYAKHVPPRAAITAVSVVRVFGTPEEYLRYVGPGYAWSSGLWIPERRELVVKPGELGTNREQRQQILRTLYHEAFHQYLHYALDRQEASAWFNEGYAAVFENAEIRDGEVVLKEDPARIKQLEDLIAAGTVDLWTLLYMPYPVFYSRDPKVMEANYALAWGLVYYLRRGAGLEKSPRYAGILDKYVDALWQTKQPDRATDAAFAGVDAAEFTRAFTAFWKSGGRRSVAARAPAVVTVGKPAPTASAPSSAPSGTKGPSEYHAP